MKCTSSRPFFNRNILQKVCIYLLLIFLCSQLLQSTRQPLRADHDLQLVPDAYRDLAAAVLEAGAEVESDGAGSVASDSSKRMRRESVVTCPPVSAPKEMEAVSDMQRV
jgi:hypothetical protein